MTEPGIRERSPELGTCDGTTHFPLGSIPHERQSHCPNWTPLDTEGDAMAASTTQGPELDFLTGAIALGRAKADRWRASAKALDVDLDVIESALVHDG